jgi:tRNA modification GTPase
MDSSTRRDTIVAIATPPGQGGIGVVRLSGPDASKLYQAVANSPLPEPRIATNTEFVVQGEPIDAGLVLHFVAPRSYTGEDVIELHAHGSPMVLDLLVAALLQAGARLAKPGEFTERAFLNGKLDLAQAEAVADLIAAQTHVAARSAHQSLRGRLSKLVDSLAEQIIALRTFIEATIDFPDDDTDFLEQADIAKRIADVETRCFELSRGVKQGVKLNEGLRTVLAGAPNAGKSSLLNALVGYEAALVTDVPGTTRDVIRETLHIGGVPLVLMDTAGLRDTDDLVEQLGNERAREALANADIVLEVVDATAPDKLDASDLVKHCEYIRVINKVDLTGDTPGSSTEDRTRVRVSALTGDGIADLRAVIRELAGLQSNPEQFIARRRHLRIFDDARYHIALAKTHAEVPTEPELAAEELRLAHDTLQAITGRFSTEDLLGEIFSTFCIGK